MKGRRSGKVARKEIPLNLHMALVDYNSDSDSDTGSPAPAPARPIAPPPAPSPKPLLPSGLALPPPKSNVRKRSAPKFTIDTTPATPAESPSIPPASKKPKQEPAGTSALLSMLPAPKQALPKAKVMPAPVRLKPLKVDADGRVESFERVYEEEGTGDQPEGEVMDFSRKGPASSSGQPAVVKPLEFKPRVLGNESKGKAKEAPLMDFFGISSSFSFSLQLSDCVLLIGRRACCTGSTTLTVTPTIPSSSAPRVISTAPQLPTFRPPSPTRLDPYPGYYALPSGEWAAHDREYYNKYYQSWQDEDAALQGGRNGAGWDAVDEGREIVGDIDVRGMGAKDEDRLPGAAPKTDEVCSFLDTFAHSCLLTDSSTLPSFYLMIQPPKAIKKNTSRTGQRNQLSALIQNVSCRPCLSCLS